LARTVQALWAVTNANQEPFTMPAPASPVSSFNHAVPPFSSHELGTPLSGQPALGASGGSSMVTRAARNGILSEREVMADLEPHWVEAIDAATD
jgi:hypothetical protein